MVVLGILYIRWNKGLPAQDRRDIPDTWPTPDPEAQALTHRQTFGRRCLKYNGRHSRSLVDVVNEYSLIFSVVSGCSCMNPPYKHKIYFLSSRQRHAIERKREGKKNKHTSVTGVSVNNLKERNFGKSWFSEASFWWWAAVRQLNGLVSLFGQQIQKETRTICTMSYISLWRTGQGLYSESDPPSLCLLKPLITPRRKQEKSQNSWYWNKLIRCTTTQKREDLSSKLLVSSQSLLLQLSVQNSAGHNNESMGWELLV